MINKNIGILLSNVHLLTSTRIKKKTQNTTSSIEWDHKTGMFEQYTIISAPYSPVQNGSGILKKKSASNQ